MQDFSEADRFALCCHWHLRQTTAQILLLWLAPAQLPPGKGRMSLSNQRCFVTWAVSSLASTTVCLESLIAISTPYQVMWTLITLAL